MMPPLAARAAYEHMDSLKTQESLLTGRSALYRAATSCCRCRLRQMNVNAADSHSTDRPPLIARTRLAEELATGFIPSTATKR